MKILRIASAPQGGYEVFAQQIEDPKGPCSVFYIAPHISNLIQNNSLTSEGELFIQQALEVQNMPETESQFNQRIADEVAAKLEELGYTQSILGALVLNKLSGRNVEEFEQMDAVRMQIINDIYVREGKI